MRSYLEATARARIQGLVDVGTFREILPPPARSVSPHLKVLDLPESFDDGVVIGNAFLDGLPVLMAAQEGRFMGGAVGEVHGAKLVGLLRLAIEQRPTGVVLLLDSGGVRLQEANPGLIAVAEIQRAVFDLRSLGIPVVALLGSSNGCFGGMSIVACSCDWIIASEEARLSVSGPEVIETVSGVEVFDASDRALVWRTMGGKHRRLMRDVDRLVSDSICEFRQSTIEFLHKVRPFDLVSLRQDQRRLEARLLKFGGCESSLEIWQNLGVPAIDVSALDAKQFRQLSEDLGNI